MGLVEATNNGVVYGPLAQGISARYKRGKVEYVAERGVVQWYSWFGADRSELISATYFCGALFLGMMITAPCFNYLFKLPRLMTSLWYFFDTYIRKSYPRNYPPPLSPMMVSTPTCERRGQFIRLWENTTLAFGVNFYLYDSYEMWTM